MTPDLECHEELCLSSEESATTAMAGSTSGPTPTDTTLRARNWCFTLNNPTLEESESLHLLSLEYPDIRYLVFQLEEGAEGTTHIQGYLELKQPYRFTRLKSMISQRVHLEKRRGTRTQARLYCMKEETRVDGPYEYGEWVPEEQPSARTQREIRELVSQGAREEEIWDKHFGWMARYYRGFREYIRIRTPPRDFKTRLIVLYGPTGTGKSRWAMENLTDLYWKPRGEWWDGYTGEASAIMDDFYGWVPYDQLLRLGDRYPLLVPTKGSFVHFRARTLAITSNKLPADWYTNIDMQAFYRRVEEWHIVTQTEHHIVHTYDAFIRLAN